MRFPLRLLGALVTLGLFLSACSDEGSSPPPTDIGDDPYCALSDQAAVLAAGFSPSTASPAEVEAFYRELLVLMDGAAEVVPDVLAEDMEIQRTVLVDTIDVLSGVGWDLALALDDLTPLYLAPEYLAADGRLEDYDIEVCGFAPVDLVPADPADAPGEPAEVPAEFVAYCNASFEASQVEDPPLDGGPAAVQAYYEGLLARLEDLAAVAPADLRTDLELIRANFVEVVDILAGAAWDVDTGFPLVEEWAADPAIADPMDAAIARVEAFDADVCGIVY
ncbi:MAG: hypothetical protein R2707_11350 [Acidimicrobiales bacterium]